jgi:uncharacterized protein (DUF433 family)
MAHELIERDPTVMMGKPVLKGTRITVELILREVAGGLPISELSRYFPGVSESGVRAAMAYAADYLSHEGIIAAE